MNRRQCDLKNFIRERIPEDSLRLVVEYMEETLKEHIESMLDSTDGGEALLRRQGRAQGLQEAINVLTNIHRDPRIGGGRSN